MNKIKLSFNRGARGYALWQLWSQSPKGETKILAAGVLAYDLSENGRMLARDGDPGREVDVKRR